MSIAQLGDPEIGGIIAGNLASLSITSRPASRTLARYGPTGVLIDPATPFTATASGPYLFSVQMNVAGPGLVWTAGLDAVFCAPLVNGAQISQAQIAFYSPTNSIDGEAPLSQDTRQLVIFLDVGDVVSALCVFKGPPNLGANGGAVATVTGLMA